MKKTILEKAFDLFVGTDEIRPVMLKPFVINDYTYATNSNVMIRCKNKYIKFEFENLEKPPNCEPFFVREQKQKNELMNFDSFDFEALKTADEMIETGEDIECVECDGFGTVEWEYEAHTKDFDCPECDGEGFSSESETIKSGKKTFAYFSIININDQFFDIKLFYKVIQVSKILNSPIILKYGGKGEFDMCFSVGVCDVLICGKNISNSIDYKIYKYPFKE